MAIGLCLAGVLAPELIAQAPRADAFDLGASHWTETLVVQGDGSIVVGGQFTNILGQSRNRMARVKADGTLDAGFNPNAGGMVECLALQPDGKLLVAGSFNWIAGRARNGIARFLPDGRLEENFNPGVLGGDYPHVYALLLQPDGTILIGGGFTSVAGQPIERLARLRADGVLDGTFRPGANGWVRCLALQADGKILVGGRFTQLAGSPRDRLGRLHPDGTLDETFHPQLNDSVNTLAVQPDGRILACGDFTTVNGLPCGYLARFVTGGDWESEFAPGATGPVDTLAIQADGKIVVGGSFLTMGGLARERLARLQPDGAIDAEFNPGANNRVRAVAILPDGRLLVAGWFTVLGGQPRARIGRLLATGPATQQLEHEGSTIQWQRGGAAPEVLSTTFQYSQDGLNWNVLGSGTRVPGGWRLDGFPRPPQGLVRARGRVSGSDNAAGWFAEDVLPLGAPLLFALPASQTVHAGQATTLQISALGVAPLTYQWWKDGVAVTNDEHVSGAQTASLTIQDLSQADAGAYHVEVANAHGSLSSSVLDLTVNLALPDPAFVPSLSGSVRMLVLHPNGRMVVGGNLRRTPAESYVGLAALKTDGTPDATFTAVAASRVNTIAVQPNGQIAIGGSFTTVTGAARSGLAKLNWEGSLDPGFNPPIKGSQISYVNALFVQPDNRLILAGAFTNVAGMPRNGFARLNPDGSNDPTFISSVAGYGEMIVSQPDGQLLVAGYFTAVPDQPKIHLARVRSDGSLDSNFQPSVEGSIGALALQADGKILVGGYFKTVGGHARNRIARLHPDGSVDLNFDPGVGGYVRALAVHADGRILVGGYFTNLAGRARANLGRLNPDGSLDRTFDPGADATVEVLALDAHGGILVGGEFKTLAGQRHLGLARLLDRTPSTDELVRSGSTVTWTRTGAVPEFWKTTFEHSPDGSQWNMLGDGIRILNGWQSPGLAFPERGAIRARGYVAGGDGCSSWFVETSLGAAAISLQPLNTSQRADELAVFSVAAGGTEPLYYQWFFDGKSLTNDARMSGANSPTLTLNNLQPSDAGDYNVTVRNTLGSVTSQAARLTVRPSLALAEVLDGRHLTWTTGGSSGWFGEDDYTHEGQDAAQSGPTDDMESSWLETTVIGPGILTFSWAVDSESDDYLEFLVNGTAPDGSRISGSVYWKTNRYTLGEGVQLLRWQYVKDIEWTSRRDCGWLDEVSFAPSHGPPIFLREPYSMTRTAGMGAPFGVEVAGLEPFTFRWFKDGVALSDAGNIAGSDTPTLIVGNILAADQGRYHVTVMNGAGEATSQGAVLTVIEPVIDAQPVAVNREPGEIASFSVAVTGTPPFTYQWFKSDVALQDQANVAGSRGPVLTLSNLEGAQAGHYRVVVQNEHGEAASQPAALSVNHCRLDPLFQPGISRAVNGMAIQNDGRIVIGGEFTTVDGTDIRYLARLHPGGSVDASFNPDPNGTVTSIGIEHDGAILIGGSFTQMGGRPCAYLARIHVDGTLDTTFAPVVDRRVTCLTVEPGGSILVGGTFTEVNGQPRVHLARLFRDGTLDLAFQPQSILEPTCLVVQPDRRILVAGSTATGLPRRGLARLQVDGTLDESFNIGVIAGSNVRCLALQADGKILIGGAFSELGGRRNTLLGRVGTDGSLDKSFDPRIGSGYDFGVSALTLQADGKILCWGRFTNAQGSARANLTRLAMDGTLDLQFSPRSVPSASSWSAPAALTVQADGAILAGGYSGLHRLIHADFAEETLLRDGSTLTWRRSGAAVEIVTAEFEHSLDGMTWSRMGSAHRIEGGWQATDLAIPSRGAVRGLGQVAAGTGTWLVETRLPLFPSEPPTILALPVMHDGEFEFTVQGSEGQILVVETSSDLITWTPVQSMGLGSEGKAWIRIAAPSTVPRGFFRVRLW